MPIIQELLIDDYSIEEAKEIQIKYHNLIAKSPKEKYIKSLKDIKIIAGVDISYYQKEKNDYGVACAVTWNLNQNKVDSYYFAKDLIKFAYKPGFLGFRECKLLAKVITKIPDIPDLVICDGHGKIHPRRFGEAVHLGYALNIPTIGVAKNPYIGYYNWDKIRLKKGNKSPIWLHNPEITFENSLNELLGYAVCLKNDLKPVFISSGYNTTLELALKVCLKSTTEHRQPEPIFIADFLSRKEVKDLG